MTNELKPCPLCGCHGVTMRSNPLNKKEHTIKCEDCPAGAQFFSSTADQAIDAWNRRPDTRAMGASAVTEAQVTAALEAFGNVDPENKINRENMRRALLAQPSEDKRDARAVDPEGAGGKGRLAKGEKGNAPEHSQVGAA